MTFVWFTLLFIVVLVALIVVHEFGHFIVAKWSGMRVDEFGLGYPPRIAAWKVGETEYSVNWLPFGGFVRIYGEDEDVGDNHRSAGGSQESRRAFGARPRILQALVLIAGIVMNLVFAWALLSVTLALGTPKALDPSEVAGARNVALTVADVVPGSPAGKAGFMAGDSILGASYGGQAFSGTDPSAFTAFVAGDSDGVPVTISILRGYQPMTLTGTPQAGVIASDSSRPALGVAVAVTGVVPVSGWKAPWEGAKLTWELTQLVAVGLWQFFASLITLTANLSQVAGPVGIAGALGQASAHGFVALMSLTAVISVNLALINLIPIPALDGGRLLFVVIETIIRRPLNPAIARTVNAVGFSLLVLLMLVVTAHDVFKIIG